MEEENRSNHSSPVAPVPEVETPNDVPSAAEIAALKMAMDARVADMPRVFGNEGLEDIFHAWAPEPIPDPDAEQAAFAVQAYTENYMEIREQYFQIHGMPGEQDPEENLEILKTWSQKTTLKNLR